MIPMNRMAAGASSLTSHNSITPTIETVHGAIMGIAAKIEAITERQEID